MRPTTKSAQRRAPPGRAPRIVPISSFRSAIRLKRDGRRHGDTGCRSPRRSSIEMPQACAVRRDVGHKRRTSRRARQPAGARAVLSRFRHGAPRRPCVVGQRSSGEPPNVRGRCVPAARRRHTAASPFACPASPAPSPFAAARRARRMNGRRPRRSSGPAATRTGPGPDTSQETHPCQRNATPIRPSRCPDPRRLRRHRPARASVRHGGRRGRRARPPLLGRPHRHPCRRAAARRRRRLTPRFPLLSAPSHSGRTQCARRRIFQGTPCNSQASS